MIVDSEANDQPDSQESTSSDREDEISSYNDKLLIMIRENVPVMEIEAALSNRLVNINYQNANGDTPLHVAVRHKNKDIVDLFIKRGANVDIPNKFYSKTPSTMVQERLKKDPNDASLKSIEASLNQALSSSPRKRTRNRPEYDAKRRKLDQTEIVDGHGLRSNFHGPIYQTKLLALFVKRALNEKLEFSLASEMEDAGALDDIVFKYKESNEKVWRFIQAKHKQDIKKDKITITELMSSSDDAFSLIKYFLSFLKIKYNDRFADAILEDFSIVTNTNFEFIDKCKNDRFELWNKYFEDEKNLQNDPILKSNTMIEPRKFKFTQKARAELRTEFKVNLLENFLHKDDKKRKRQKKQQTEQQTEPQNESQNEPQNESQTEPETESQTEQQDNEILLIKDKLMHVSNIKREKNGEKLIDEIKKSFDTYKGKKQKESIVKLVKKMMEFLSGMEGLKDIFKTIKNSTEELEKSRAGSLLAKNHLLTLKSFIENVYKVIEKIGRDVPTDVGKNEIIHEERKFRKILYSEDLDWIKNEIINGSSFSQKHRIAKDTIGTIKKENNLEEVKKALDGQIKSILLNISILKVAFIDDIFDECLDEFFDKFRIITNYFNEEQLSEILRKEVSEKFGLLNVDLVRDSFEREMIEFLKAKQGYFYNEKDGNSFFKNMEQQINMFMCYGLSKLYTEKLEAYGIFFDAKFKRINQLCEFLSNESRRVFHLSAKFTRLCAIKVLRNLTDSGQFKEDDSFIFIRLGTILHQEKTREFILNAFQSGTQLDAQLDTQSSTQSVPNKNAVDLCVIECSQECRKNGENVEKLTYNLSEKLMAILKKNSNKKLIIIAPDDDELMNQIKIRCENKWPNIPLFSDANSNGQLQPCIYTKDEIEFVHLDLVSQKTVLATKVKFQEKDSVSFDQLIDTNLACTVIDSENLLRLIENEPIQIGDEKAFSSIGYVKDFYIDRDFNLEANPVDDTSNFSERELVEQVQKVTLLVNDAGMGKSTVLTSIAKEMRQNNQNAWIVRIDLNDHASTVQAPHSLNRINFKRDDIEKCIEFVPKMIVRGKADAPDIKLQRKLLEESLRKTQFRYKKPPILILLDGFDEISPSYTEKTIILLEALKETDIDQLWITTRPHDHLQNELNSTVYYLQSLKRPEQTQFLDNFLKWHIRCGKFSVDTIPAKDRSYAQIRKHLQEIKKANLNDTLTKSIDGLLKKYPTKSDKIDELKNDLKSLSFVEYVEENLLSLWDKGVLEKHKSFHGTPMHLWMLAVVVSAEKKLISRLEPFQLYQKFVDIKFGIFYHIKSKLKRGNQGAKDTKEDHENYLLNERHNSLAVKFFFPNEYEGKLLPDLSTLDEMKQEIIKSKGERFARGGLISLRSEELEFIHHSFAEFFFCKYLMKNLGDERVQTILFRNILRESSYGVIRLFFNEQLQVLSDEEIEEKSNAITNNSKRFIEQNCIKTILQNENHSGIIRFLNMG